MADTVVMPRRKYGHMVHNLPQVPPPEKCRYCILGYPCPVHKTDGKKQVDGQKKDGKKK